MGGNAAEKGGLGLQAEGQIELLLAGRRQGKRAADRFPSGQDDQDPSDRLLGDPDLKTSSCIML